MTTTSTPPPVDANPAATPPPPRHEGAKLSPRTLAIVTAVIVVLAGLVVYLGFLRGGPTNAAPVANLPTTQATSPPPSAPPPSAPPTTAPPTTAPPSTSPAPGGSSGAIPLGNGVALVLASGWSVANQGPPLVLTYASPQAACLVNLDQSSASDPGAALDAELQSLSAITNVTITGSTGVQHLGGNVNFQAAIAQGFTGTLSTNQGTQPVAGEFFDLLDAQTGANAFVVAFSDSASDFKSVSSSVLQMVNSLLQPA